MIYSSTTMKQIKKIKVDELQEETRRNIVTCTLSKQELGLDTYVFDCFTHIVPMFKNETKTRRIVSNINIDVNVPVFTSFNKVKAVNLFKWLFPEKKTKQYFDTAVRLDGGIKTTNQYVNDDVFFFRVYVMILPLDSKNEMVAVKMETRDENDELCVISDDCYISKHPDCVIGEKLIRVANFTPGNSNIRISGNYVIEKDHGIFIQPIMVLNGEFSSKIANPTFSVVCFSRYNISVQP